MTADIKREICNYVATLGCVRATKLMAEFKSRYGWITSEELRVILIELSANGNLKEIEIIFKDKSQDAIFLPKGTRVNT
jgi:hypothetical protein